MKRLKELPLNLVIAIVLAIAFISEKSNGKDLVSMLVYGFLFLLNVFFGLMFIFLPEGIDDEQPAESE